MYQWETYTTTQRQQLMNLQLGREEQWKHEVMMKTYDTRPEHLDPFNDTVDSAAAYLSTWIQEALNEELTKRENTSSKNRLPEWTYQIWNLGPDRIATVFVKTLLESVFKSARFKDMDFAKNIYALPTAQGVSRDVGNACWDICRWIAAKDDSYGWYKKQSRFFKNWTNKRRRAFTKKVNALPELSLKDKDRFGHAILRIAEASGILSTRAVREIASTKAKKGIITRKYVMPAEGLIESLYTSVDDYITALMPNRLPMVCRPVEHIKGEAGGLMDWTLRSKRKTAKIRMSATDDMFENDIADVDPSCMSDTTRTVINGLQATEWRINTNILSVMDNLWKNNRIVGSLPEYEAPDHEMESKFPEEGTKAEQHVWLKIREQRWAKWHKTEALRQQHILRINEARKLTNFTLWHAYFCDFRGRYYSDSYLLHPQGGDLDKSLIMFAEPTDVEPEDIYWIKVNLANLMGIDKVSFDQRVTWVDCQMAQWREIVSDPYGTTELWEDDATKKNASFQRLAAIFDFIMAIDEGKSQIPVQLDGACNGVQHWAALTRDEKIGPEVNLSPNDIPQDVYQLVADGCTNLCIADPTDWHERFLLHWQGTIPRGVCKRSVMCDPYGISSHSIGNYILNEGHLNWITDHDEQRQAMDSMRKLICSSKDKQMAHCNHGKELVKLLAGWLGDTPLSWKTPSGFTVINKYRKPAIDTNAVRIWNKQFQLNFQIWTNEHHNKKAATAMPPNFVHSLDAAHMSLVVVALMAIQCKYFSFIHDSFGVPAPFIKQLRTIIKETFYEIHTKDLLQDLIHRTEVIMGESLPAQHPAHQHNIRGNFNIREVLKSEYLFG
tara:strand:+ start:1003 stop:3510 length:2508 start_codon:yes stop_codon:yes gene_type:complete